MKSIIDFLINSWGISPAVAPSMVVTITTFILGYLITWFATFVSNQVKKYKYKSILKVIIKQYFERCKLQADELDGFLKQPGYLHGGGYELVYASNFSQNYLSSIDVKIFIENFSSIFKKGRSIEIAELFELIEKVKFAKEMLEITSKEVHAHYKEYFKIYNENLESLRKIREDFPLKYDGKELEINFVQYINTIVEIFKTWQENGGKTYIAATLNEVVNPIHNLTKKTNVINTLTREIIDLTLACSNAANNINKGEEYLKSQALNTKITYEKSYNKGNALLDDWNQQSFLIRVKNYFTYPYFS